MAASSSKRADVWYQVLLIGDSGVGKTCIIHRQCKNEFPKLANPNIGIDFYETVITIEGGKLMGIMFVDTAGTERFHAVMPAFYHKADAFVIVYDITKQSSFQELTHWLDTIDEATNPKNRGMKLMLIGNKADLEDDREVSYDEGRRFAEERQMGFFEISAKTEKNFSTAMNYLTKKLEKHAMASDGIESSQSSIQPHEDIEHCQPNDQVHEEPARPNGGCSC